MLLVIRRLTGLEAEDLALDRLRSSWKHAIIWNRQSFNLLQRKERTFDFRKLTRGRNDNSRRFISFHLDILEFWEVSCLFEVEVVRLPKTTKSLKPETSRIFFIIVDKQAADAIFDLLQHSHVHSQKLKVFIFVYCFPNLRRYRSSFVLEVLEHCRGYASFVC